MTSVAEKKGYQMVLKRHPLIIVILIFSYFSFLTLHSCSIPVNPIYNPDNVTINLILPDSVTQPSYTRDTTVIKIATKLFSLVDSVKLSVNAVKDSIFRSVSDTLPVNLVFNDSGSMIIIATAYCKDKVIKNCQKILHVHKNPLTPPDTVFFKTLSDSSTLLYWNKIAAAQKYNVFRSLLTNDTFSLLATISDSSYTDTSLKANTDYYYKIQSINSRNISSDLSYIFSARIVLSVWDKLIWDQDKWE
jgi:hypothetical protein